jgi:hypothetical protein
MSCPHTELYTVSPFFCVLPGIPAAAPLASAWLVIKFANLLQSTAGDQLKYRHRQQFFLVLLARLSLVPCLPHVSPQPHTHSQEAQTLYASGIGWYTNGSTDWHTHGMHACMQ